MPFLAVINFDKTVNETVYFDQSFEVLPRNRPPLKFRSQIT
jgi:hypothetical protein